MRIAMLLHKSVEHDSRVRRAGRALAEDGHEVTVLHLPRVRGQLDGELEGVRVQSVTPPPWVRWRLPGFAYRAVFLAAFVLALLRLRPDAVHAHDAAMLAPGRLGAWAVGARLVYDSHEYAMGVPYRESGWARGVSALERAVVPRCDSVITVSDGIARRLQDRYRLDQLPVVVRNLPDPAESDPNFEAPDLRRQLAIAPGAPLIMHLGAAARDRGCETLVLALSEVSEAHLLFLGVDDPEYAGRIERLASERGLSARVHQRPSVPVGQIRAYVKQADVGVSLLEDTCENHRLALPNKVFEYLEAGLPVLASDLPELRDLLAGSEVGLTVDPARPEQVARGIVAALGRRDASPPGGKTDFPSWEAERRRLLTIYR